MTGHPENNMMADVTKISERVDMAAASDVGDVRLANEDFYYFSKSKKFFVLCDGMGGHRGGDLASKMAGETIRDILFGNETVRNSVVIKNKAFDLTRACQDLELDQLPITALKLVSGIRLANRRLLAAARKRHNQKRMGTTICAVLVDGKNLIIAHLGDSRVYRLRNGEFSCLTSDHSWLNESDGINDNKNGNGPSEKTLSRAIGLERKTRIDLQITPLQQNDLYLLCTDGLHNALRPEQMHCILSAYEGSLQHKISNLVTSARLMDGSDNITGGLVQISDAFPVTVVEEEERTYTIPEESGRVAAFLDRWSKSLYRDNRANRAVKTSAIAFMAVLALVLILTALLLN